MKKKLLAMLLAAVLAVSLLPGMAFAADSEPGIITSPVDLETLRMEDTTFVLQYWEQASVDYEEMAVTLIREAETTTVDPDYLGPCFELPLGVTLTVNAFNPEGKFAVRFYAWSDPDGGGVFEQRIPNPAGGLFPVNVAEPLNAGHYGGSAFYLDGDLNGSSGKVLTEGAYATLVPWTDPVAYQIPSTFRITSDYLTELYGPNTFLEIALPAEDGDVYYHFLLTGKDAVEDPGEDETPPAEPTAPSFTDVNDGDWYAPAVAWAAEQGYINGVGNNRFAPLNDCTHSQILTMLWRAAEKPGANPSPFTVDSAYQGAVDWAYEQGMIDDTFEPDDGCTRADVVKYIWAVLGEESDAVVSFDDVDADADYAAAVAWAVEVGVADPNGTGNNQFTPDKVCNRGTIATFLWRAYVLEVRFSSNVLS